MTNSKSAGPQVAIPVGRIEDLLKNFEKASDQFLEARDQLATAKRVLTRRVIEMDMDECLTVSVGKLRRMIRS